MIIQNPDGSLGYIEEKDVRVPIEPEVDTLTLEPEVDTLTLEPEVNTLTLEKEKKIVIYFCYQEMFFNFILPVYLNQIYIIFPVILCTLTGINSIKYNNKGGYIFYIIYLMIDYVYKLSLLNLLIIYDKVTLSYSVYLSLFVVILIFNTFAMRLFIKYYKFFY
jgi:hypothetical protein